MRSHRWIAVVWLAGSSAAAAISVRIAAPVENQVVIDQLDVAAYVSSDRQLASVTATVEGQAVPLIYNASWGGRVSVAHLPYGSWSLRVDALDVDGASGSASTTFLIDRPPRLVLEEPVRAILARPEFRVRARCDDDGPEPCEVHVKVSRWPSDPRFGLGETVGEWSSLGAFDQTLCLRTFEGQSLALLVYARDQPIGRITTAAPINLVVSSSPSLSVVTMVPGEILDSDGAHVLYRDGEWVSWLLNRAEGGSSTRLGNHSDQCVPCGLGCIRCTPFGWLSPAGALILSGFSLMEWHAGRLDSLAEGIGRVSVRGDAALWFSNTLPPSSPTHYRFSTQTATPIAESCMQYQLGAGGDAYCMTDHTVVALTDGGVVALPDAGAATFDSFAVDEPYVAVAAISHTYPSPRAELLLAGMGDAVDVGEISYPPSYRLSGGWLAFARAAGASGEPQVFVRAPNGVTQQVSYLGAPASVEAVAAGGEVMFLSRGHRYLGALDGGVWDLGSAAGRAFSSGGWYVYQANALLRATLSDAGTYRTPECSSEPGDAGVQPEEPRPRRACGCGYGAELPSAFLLLALAMGMGRRQALKSPARN